MKISNKALMAMAMAFLVSVSLAEAGITGLSRVELAQDTIFGSSSGRVWLLSWNAIDTDRIEGSLTPSEFKSQAGVASSDTFTLRMDSGDEYARYRIFSSGDKRPVYKSQAIVLNSWKKDTMQSMILSQCQDINGDGRLRYGDDYIWKADHLGRERAACFDNQESQLAQIADIRSPESIFSTSWTLSAAGSTETKSLTNSDGIGTGSTTRFGNLALIKWQGSLTTGKKAPEPIGVIAAHSNSFGGWRVIDLSKYRDWDNYLKVSASSCFDDVVSTGMDAGVCTRQLEDKANNAILPTSNGIFKFAQVSDNSLTNGAFKLDKDINGQVLEGMSIPQYQLFINSDTLRLVVPVGEPEIVSLDKPRIDELGAGKITGIFKNKGGDAGSFEARVVSCSPSGEFSPTGIVQRFNLNAGQQATKTFSIGFSSTSNEKEVSGSCTVELKETTTGRAVSATTQVTGVQANECTPGQRFATVDPSTGREAIAECGSNGISKSLVEVCDSGERVSNEGGTLVCKSVSTGGFTCPAGTEEKKRFFNVFGSSTCEPIDKGFGLNKKTADIIVFSAGIGVAALALISIARKRFDFSKARAELIAIATAAGAVVSYIAIAAVLTNPVVLFIGGIFAIVLGAVLIRRLV